MGVQVLIKPMMRPPALAAGGLVVVFALVAGNALLLQPQPHPAPLVSTRTTPDEPTRYLDASTLTAEPEAIERRADDLVLAVQSALRQSGHYGGPLDGLSGPQTEQAILVFQAASSLPATGEPSLELLAEIKAAKAQDQSSLAELAAAEPEPTPDPRVAAVQHALAISAYGPLRMDGFLGPQTHDAIRRFQQDHGLQPTGEITDALIVELRAAGALTDD